MSNKTSRLVAATAAGLFAIAALVALVDGIGYAAPTNEQVTLTWYVRNNSLLEMQWQDEMIQAFQATHPTITINVIRCSANRDCTLRQNGMWLQGNPPDVWSTGQNGEGFNSHFLRGRLADLTPFINGSNPLDLGDFFTETIAIYTVDGKIYGLPILSGGSFLFYNKDMFDAAGVSYPPTDWDDPTWTWDAMVSKAISLTQNYGDPDTVQYGVTTDWLWPLDAYAWLWGQDLFPASAYQTGFASESYLDTPMATLAYQAAQDLICAHQVSPLKHELYELGGVVEAFRNQRVAMVATGVWGLWMFQDVGFDWGFAALPKGAPGARDVVFTDEWVMSSATAYPAEAWEFIKFLVSPEAQRAYMQITNAPPVRQSLMPEWSKLFSATMTITQVQQVHTGALAHGAESPNHLLVDYNEIDMVLSEELNPLWHDCNASVTDTLASADARLEQTLAWIIQMHTVPTVTLDINTGGVVTTNDGVATLIFGAGTVAETTVVSVTSEQAILESPGLVSAGGIVHVQATIRDTGEAITQTNAPYTMTVAYDEGTLGALAIQSVARTSRVQESTLALYWWNPVSRVWEREPTSQVDTTAKVVQATPTRFGLFAVFGKRQVYLPLVVRNY